MQLMFTYRPKIIRNLWRAFILLMMLPSLAFEQTNSKISLKFNNTEISSVLRSIETQSGYTFYFSAVTLDVKTPVSINVKQAPLEKVLDELLKPFKVDYIIKEKSIIIRRIKEVEKKEEGFPIIDTVPNVSVSGKVVDSKGAPMTGVTVSVKGKPVNSITDANGDFLFSAIPSNATLVFSNIGYERQELKIKGSTVISIALKEKVTDLEKVEIVSTGYQDIPKERATGSFSKVDNKTFNRRVSNNVLDRIIDNVPGLIFTPNDPGGDPINRVQIRGIATIQGNTKPLIIVDNFIFEGDLNSINPNDVESITVLKDAAAASIWGARAGNGVIVINLKKGQTRTSPLVNFVANMTIIPKPDFTTLPTVRSRDIIELEKSRFNRGFYDSELNDEISYPVLSPIIEILNQQKTGKITAIEAQKLISSYETFDARQSVTDHLYRNAIMQQYSLSVSGGTGNYLYNTSIGYDKSDYSSINNRNDRITSRINNHWNISKNIKFSVEINYASTTETLRNLVQPSDVLTNPYNKIADVKNNPLSIPFKYRKTYVDTISFPGLLDWHFYPIAEASNGNQKNSSENIRFQSMLEYSFLKHFKLSANYQYAKSHLGTTSIQSTELFKVRDLINQFVQIPMNSNDLAYPYPLGEIVSKSTGISTAWNFRTQLDFNITKSKYSIKSIIGIEVREAKSETSTMPIQYGFDKNTNTYQIPLFGTWNTRPFGSGIISANTAIESGNINRFGSIYTNVSHNYQSKYTFTTSGRIDQSNYFGVAINDRIVPLWSAGIAWIISNESFITSKYLTHLALRTTYGYNGNVTPGTTPQATMQYLPPILPPYNIPSAEIKTLPNPNIRWERVRQINVGIDYGLFGGLLTGTIEAYTKDGTDLISGIPTSLTTGINEYIGNNASIKTKGIDIQIATNNKIGKVNIENRFIFNYNTNKVKYFAKDLTNQFWSPISYSGSLIPIIGKPIDKLYSYYYAGLDATGNSQFILDNKIAYSDQYRDARLKDYRFNGRSTPSYAGNFRTDIAWNALTLSFGFNFALGYKFRRTSFDGSIPSNNSLVHEDYYQTWKKPGDELRTIIPGFQDSYIDYRYGIYSQADVLIEKGDHIKFQDIKAEYTFNKIFKTKSKLSNSSFYVYVNNIGIIWKQSAFNPDQQSRLLPATRPSYSIGFKISNL